MSSEQLSTRILSEQSRLNQMILEEERHQRSSLTNILRSQEIFMIYLVHHETPAITISALSNRARRLKRLFGLNLIVVDYIQLMRTNSKKNEQVQEISEITQGLKALAKELSVPVLALSQLSRAVEQRDDKIPPLSDLKSPVLLSKMLM